MLQSYSVFRTANAANNNGSRFRVWWQFLLIALVSMVVYGNTLDVPFYLDDYSSIVDNPAINRGGGLAQLWNYAPLRIVGYSTLALNYQLNHFQPAGYHIVNILIHILAGLSLFALARALLQSPAVRGSSRIVIRWLPLLAALIFVAHPMQTQAVTYVVQRLASLTALWYLSSLACYVYGRSGRGGNFAGLLYLASFCFALLAFFTKQNSFTLPLAIIALEFIFFPADRRRILRFVVPVALLGFLLWCLLVFAAGFQALSPASLDALTKETKNISRMSYFMTQTQVLWTYIRMFFWPTGLHLDHHVLPVSALTAKSMAALLAHLGVIGGSVVLRRRYPVLAFGILFFYISSLVESSLIPIRDLMFEHRSYLPNAGLCLAVCWFFLALPVRNRSGRKLLYAFPVLWLIVLAVLSWQRNNVWRDPVALWRDSAVNAPYLARPWNEYAKHLIERGQFKEAIAVFQATMKRLGGEGQSPGSYLEETAAVNFMMVLAREGETDLALQVADDFLKRNVKPLNRSKMLANKGNLYFQNRKLAQAEESYRLAIASYETNTAPMNNLGTLLMMQGRLDEAEEMFLMSLRVDPRFEPGRQKLQQVQELIRNRGGN